MRHLIVFSYLGASSKHLLGVTAGLSGFFVYRVGPSRIPTAVPLEVPYRTEHAVDRKTRLVCMDRPYHIPYCTKKSDLSVHHVPRQNGDGSQPDIVQTKVQKSSTVVSPSADILVLSSDLSCILFFLQIHCMQCSDSYSSIMNTS